MNIKTITNLQNLVPYNKNKFYEFVKDHASGIDDAEEKIQTIVEEVELTVFADMSYDQLIDSAILAATQNIQNDIDYEKVATRFSLTQIYKSALDLSGNYKTYEELYRSSFPKYINFAIGQKLLNPELAILFDLEELSSALTLDRDDVYTYIGITTAENRYMIKDRDQNTIETPQFMWMRVAMGLSLKEDNPTEMAKVFYDKLSKQEYIPGGSTNIGSGSTYPVLSNCYLIETQDDIHSIFDNVKNVAIISKATGGIGISVTKLRAAGSPVRSNNTFSTGPIPFIKVMDAALKSVSRAGKKAGAMCVYIENWHYNFPEFIDLRQNAGDDYRRVRTADTAVYISDEFMKRVINNDKWYMFDPLETPELAELYGNEFSRKYEEYIEKAERGEIKMFNVVPAREQMKQILNSLQGTSHPWLTWKDTINLRALNNNTGTIHCSNLCTEICLPQDKDNIAVCNLAYVNLANHVLYTGNNPENKMDWKRLEETVRIAIHHLDNLVDVNMSPLKETRNSDENNRAVGLGIMGFSEALEKFGYAYDSEEAYNLMDKAAEFISYISIDESCNLAEERGAYPNFQGSMWSKGYVPFDTIEKVAKSRKGEDLTMYDREYNEILMAQPKVSEGTNPVMKSLDILKTRIQKGTQSASSQESKELFEIFGQITEYMDRMTNNQSPSNSEVATTAEYTVENKAGEGTDLRQSRRMKLDWSALRTKVKKGMRNATTMAVAPNASTGLVAGTSPGLDPRFAQIFSRATSTGKFLDINHNLVKSLKALGIWEEVRDKVLENYGDISKIEEIPQEIRNVYKTSFQISPFAYIEVASRAQKWIDQSLSRNMYLATRDIDEMVAIYTEAWRRGLKTTYYLHVKPRHTSEQSTVKVNKGQQINKKGFSSLKPTAQVSLVDNTKEIKGFGFAGVQKEQEVVEIAASLDRTQQPLTGGSSGGFGFSKASSVVEETAVMSEKVNFTKVKKKINFDACPLDPAERAACEGCQ